MQTSALENKNIEELFKEVALKIRNQGQQGGSQKTIEINNKDKATELKLDKDNANVEKKKGCC